MRWHTMKMEVLSFATYNRWEGTQWYVPFYTLCCMPPRRLPLLQLTNQRTHPRGTHKYSFPHLPCYMPPALLSRPPLAGDISKLCSVLAATGFPTVRINNKPTCRWRIGERRGRAVVQSRTLHLHFSTRTPLPTKTFRYYILTEDNIV